MVSRQNNFDFLRLIFASFVIITHSYNLSGSRDTDWLTKISNNQISFSYIGVKGFFIISGYLIFKSLLRTESIVDYYWKRLLRLFPALVVVLILTVLLAPFVYQSSIPYLDNRSVYTYIPNNLSLYFVQYNISGVFETNPYKGAINGSLWTICYEFSMYIMVSLLFVFRKMKSIFIIVLLMFVCSFILFNFFPGFFNSLFSKFAVHSNHFYTLMCYFTGGMLMVFFDNKQIKHKAILISVSIILLIASLYLDVFNYAGYFLLPLIVIFIGKSSTKCINKIGETIGDTSYGIYIYSFPIQQTLMYYFKLDTFQLMLFSFILSFLFGYISWHIIEKKALIHKDLYSNWMKKIRS